MNAPLKCSRQLNKDGALSLDVSTGGDYSSANYKINNNFQHYISIKNLEKFKKTVS